MKKIECKNIFRAIVFLCIIQYSQAKPEYAKNCVDIIRAKSKSIFIEISGGVTLENLSDYIIDGVDAISSGALMHQAQNQKLKLEFMEAQI